MRKTLLWLTALLAAIVCGCRQENAGVAPGLYVEQATLGTYPGDSPLVSGTASGWTALSSIRFSLEAWDYDYVLDLGSSCPKVFNFSVRPDVPATATFPQTLKITVTDADGITAEASVPVAFLPDTAAPKPDETVITDVEIAYENGEGVWKPSYSFTDDRAVDWVRLQIPVLGIDEKADGSGKTGRLSGTYTFDTVGSYPATLSAADTTGNTYSQALNLVVMAPEIEDEISDYPQMYLFDPDENEADYLNGFWHYMFRDAAFCYKVAFYASHDNYHIYFAPTQSQDADLFGASPFFPTKILNKNGYVVPVVIEKKGYYGIYVDIKNHVFTLWDYDVTSAYEGAPYTGNLTPSGTGFFAEDWYVPYGQLMTKVEGHDYVFTTQLETIAYTGARSYYFANVDTWDPIFRCDNKGQQWYVYADGPCCQFTSDYVGTVDMFLDTAIPWGWIKKAE